MLVGLQPAGEMGRTITWRRKDTHEHPVNWLGS
ncbi:hypothetical protein F441_14931 [Phytophthora nicotianae CJ01A1]|uniref:Uncharacterized protein n=3 Tax=Phytophthora nicotianae TaxID=4792 RepID=W2YQN8_PHYNI|nr:hypothetical protein L916_14586 [Phytophthora nicotianae]ETP09196.1 hypothetical protein F441_14931 [Phytophthora nicotianae CJ01A1]ETP37246.1 hypothetical protein F442_14945 [Phytophthora nicotianae P10297]